MSKYRVIYWRDIPVQVQVRDGGTRGGRLLTPRFQQTVHRAAFRAKAITGFDYINEWRPSDWIESQETAADTIEAITAELEAAYDTERLDRLARNKGYEPHDD